MTNTYGIAITCVLSDRLSVMKKIIIVLFCLLLTNTNAELLIVEDFDFRKKGNVYEKTFRMPYNFWGSGVKVGFCFHDSQNQIVTYNGMTFTKPIRTEWMDKLYVLWRTPSLEDIMDNCKMRLNSEECYKKTEKWMEKQIKDLEFYHPNQFFKFKFTFVSFNKPEEKWEKIIEFPLYDKPKTYSESFRYSRNCLNLFSSFDTQPWRKYSIRIEVLEDTTFPNEIDEFRVYINNPSRKY